MHDLRRPRHTLQKSTREHKIAEHFQRGLPVSSLCQCAIWAHGANRAEEVRVHQSSLDLGHNSHNPCEKRVKSPQCPASAPQSNETG
jgi:hypothetical protein